MTDAIDGFIQSERNAGWWKNARDQEDYKRRGHGIRELIYDTTIEELESEIGEIEQRIDKGWVLLNDNSEALGDAAVGWEREWLRLVRRYEVLWEIRRHIAVRVAYGLPTVRPSVQADVQNVTQQLIAAEQIEMFR